MSAEWSLITLHSALITELDMGISARVILTCIWGAIIAAALAAPLLSVLFPTAAFFTYLPFSFVCHQMPERSFELLHHPLAVCHRCSGIYIGLLLGTPPATFFFRISPRARRTCIITAAALLATDALLPYTGLWSGFWICRFLTGLAFGLTAAPLAAMGLDETIKALSMRGRAVLQPDKGV